MVGNNLQYTCFQNSHRRNNESLLTCRCNAIYLVIAWRVMLCMLVFGLCCQVGSTFAQTTANTASPAVHRTGKLPERGRRPAGEQVRHASFGMNDSMDDANYDATLTPAASNYEAIDMRADGVCCNGCGAVPDACCCHPFGWLLDWSRGDLWLGTTSFTGAGNFLGVAAGDQGKSQGISDFKRDSTLGRDCLVSWGDNLVLRSACVSLSLNSMARLLATIVGSRLLLLQDFFGGLIMAYRGDW